MEAALVGGVALPRPAKLALASVVALPLLQLAVERAVTLPIGPSRMLTIALWSLAWIPLAWLALERLAGSLPRIARITAALLVPALVVAHLLALSRLGDGPFGPVPGGPFAAPAVSAPSSWAFAAEHRYAELEVDVAKPRTLETLVLVHEGALYVAANRPEDKRWPRTVRDDGRVRVRLGGPEVYGLRAVAVAASEEAVLNAALTEKYGFDASLGGAIWFFRLEP